MRRRLFNLAATLSLVLCVAVAGLWVHSEFHAVSWGYGGSRNPNGFTREWEVGSTHGRVLWMLAWHWGTSFLEYEGPYVRSGPTDPVRWRWMPASTRQSYGAAGNYVGYDAASFHVERMRALAVGWDRRCVFVPDWFLMGVFLVLPAMRWLKKKPVPGRCPACGYDLRATPHRCPECGAAPAEAPPATARR